LERHTALEVIWGRIVELSIDDREHTMPGPKQEGILTRIDSAKYRKAAVSQESSIVR
jgi:hypothetical protein